MSGLGYRQRAILRILEGRRAVPFGLLVRALDDSAPSAYNNTNVALRGLRERGLVRSPRRGWWEAA